MPPEVSLRNGKIIHQKNHLIVIILIFFKGYHADYVAVFRRHLESEYEVQIRDGRISADSDQVVQGLRDDFEILQVERQVDKILVDNVPSKQSTILLELLQPVRNDLILEIKKLNKILQKKVQKKMRNKNNWLCKQKCQTGSVIYNFTQFCIPKELSEFMETGLNNVPEVLIDDAAVLEEVENEVKIACRNVFKSIIGVFPYSVTLKDSLDTIIRNLMILAPNNKHLLDTLSRLREFYVFRLLLFIKSLKRSKNSGGLCIMEEIK